ncbi:hypothetical protein [Oenococcus sp.]|uniref:hypothetical protein n=1 Tax=Oenococcus sp. TaxID=1979414 RepID=UPI0039E871A6
MAWQCFWNIILIYDAVGSTPFKHSDYLTAINENGYVTNVKLIVDEIHGDDLTGLSAFV